MNNFPTMPVLTQEQQKIITDTCNVMVNRADSSEHSQNLRVVAQIALAALRAEPVHQFIVNNPDNDGYAEWADCNTDYFSKEPRDMRRVLYTAPPAPVLKSIELPCADHETDDGYEFCRKETVIAAIRAAGYEVK